MTPKLFAGLTVAAGVSLAAAVTVYGTHNQWSSGSLSGAPVLPKLAERANDVAAIALRQGEKTLTLERRDGAWTLKERNAYLVRAEAVRSLVVRLAQARLAEKKTRKADRYRLLELEDPTDKDAKSRQVRLLGEDGKLIGELVLGAKRYQAFGSGKAGSYVRLPGDEQTWLANADVDVSLDVKDWVDRSVFKTDTSGVKSVVLALPGEPAFTIRRTEGAKGGFELADMPEGKKLKAGATFSSVPDAFASIELEDLRKLAETPVGPKVSVATFETQKGLTVTFRMRKEGNDHWLSLSATGIGDAKKTAQDLKQRAEGWEFKIPSWKAQALFKRKSEFFETS
ncbi:MAG: DUF4340 domain-containing protein [Hyphomicrobiales bacterium]|nr:DUF4340 domain-containing protein [Hyphomicrobiales bacterium]